MDSSQPLIIYMELAADFSYLCSTTTTEASEVQARLQELSTGVSQPNHVHSVLLRELFGRQDATNRQVEQARSRVLDDIRSSTNQTIRSANTRTSTRTIGGSIVSTIPSNYHGNASTSGSRLPHNSDQISIMSMRSTLSLRLGRPAYMEALEASKAYKRLRYFGRGIDSSAESVFSSESGCSTGRWSMLSAITLGDLSTSQIAVLNLPIGLADFYNPNPLLEPSLTETHRSSCPKPRRKWSSHGLLHNVIKNGNGFVIRILLAVGVDVEELDSNGRTPLVHAAMKHQEAICKLLLDKGANAAALRAFTSGMDLKERSELLDRSLRNAMNEGLKSETTLRLLVLMALGTNGGGNDNRSSSQINIAIDMSYRLAVLAIIHLEPRVLVEVDTEGRTPFAYAYLLRRNGVCEALLQSSKLDIETATEVVKLEGDFTGRVHAVIEEKCLQLLRLQLLFATGVDLETVGIKGQTPLAHAAEVVLSSEDIDYESWNDICKALLDKASTANIETLKKIRPKPGARRCITTSMQELVQQLVGKDYKSILVLLSLIRSRDAEGWTPLASAAFNLNEALCKFLVEKGCSLCLGTEKKEQLTSILSSRVHIAAKGGHGMALQLLLDMGADIDERKTNSTGKTALLEAVYYNHLPCAKILIERGADATISSTEGGSVLHIAAWRSIDGEMMKFLLGQTRELVNAKNDYGETPLHDCSYRSHIVCLENSKMLVQAGASLTIKNNDGRTPYECARKRESKGIAKYLWSQLSPEQQADEIPPLSDW